MRILHLAKGGSEEGRKEENRSPTAAHCNVLLSLLLGSLLLSCVIGQSLLPEKKSEKDASLFWLYNIRVLYI